MSSDNIAIRARGLGKKYKISRPQEKYHSSAMPLSIQ